MNLFENMKPVLDIKWEEPNRTGAPALHIGENGARSDTLTGVKWLSETQFMVAHRNGCRLGYFDVRKSMSPLVTQVVSHATDILDIKKISDSEYEVAVSGCWDVLFSTFTLNIQDDTLKYKKTVKHKNRSFSHGVRYQKNGEIWLALHTGRHPRIDNGRKSWKLPSPWGARDVFFNDENTKVYAIAVSKSPRLEKNQNPSISIWSFDLNQKDTFFKKQKWVKVYELSDCHADSAQIYKEIFWFPDQLNDVVIGVDINKGEIIHRITYENMTFPHGISISSNGLMAIANYGTSNICIFDLREIN
jgi:hypothetical protein